MANTTVNASNARKNIYQLLKDVNQNHKEIKIISEVVIKNSAKKRLEEN